ncbi:hypothetical protein PIB30_053325 [Stylosanthes scabra]|uniref:Uncharacterized protein n=1 Tax=Stylosanthes scabra TaxID=79078 RepID=A0ABU6QKA6_9FABA|nr:hypothetical protein [Stylosanthes scabra]
MEKWEETHYRKWGQSKKGTNFEDFGILILKTAEERHTRNKFLISFSPSNTSLCVRFLALSNDLVRHRPYHYLRLDVTSPTSQDSSPEVAARAARRSLVDLLRFSSRSFSSRSICGADQRSRSCHVSFNQRPSLTHLPNP